MARKHIILPLHIWNIDTLSVTERLVLSVVHGYTDQGKPCFMTNTGFSKLLHVSKRTASRAVSTLLEGGYLEAEGGGHGRHLKCRECLGGVDTSVQGGWTPVSTRNIESNNKLIDKINKMDEVEEKARPSQWESVRDYFQQLNGAEKTHYGDHLMHWAKDFHAYYEARQWKNKHGEIRAWRPVALAWYRRSAKSAPQRAIKRRDSETIRGDIAWHQRRLSYYEIEKPHLIQREVLAIEALKQELNEQ